MRITQTNNAMKILFVEDNAVDAAVTATAIRREQPQCTIDIACTLEEARRCLAEISSYTLVLLDLNLPDGSGIELLYELRKHCDDVPVAVLTSADRVEEVQVALKAGADRYIVKHSHYLRELPARLLQTRRRARRLTDISPGPMRVLTVGCSPADQRAMAEQAALSSPLLEWLPCASAEELRADADAATVVLIDTDRCRDSLDALIASCADNDVPAVLLSSSSSATLAARVADRCISEWLIKGDGMIERIPLMLELAHQRAALAREKLALQTMVSRLDHLLASNPTILYSLQPHGDGYIINWVSANVEKILGYAPSEVTQLGWWRRVLHPDDRAKLLLEVAEMRRRLEHDHEYRVICADGTTRWLRDQRRVLLDDAGAVIEVVGSWNDVTLQREREQRIAQLTQFDPLTGLFNRWAFENRLSVALASPNNGGSVGVLLIDLVGLQAINGSFGIQAGDDLLRQVAKHLNSSLPDGAAAARTSGDEFAVMLTQTAPSQFVAAAHALAERIAQAAVLGDGIELRVDCCIGIAVASSSSTAATLLQQADSALNQAKQRGKGAVALYEAKLSAATRQQLHIAARLRLAIEQQQIQVWYQPKAEVASGRIIGVEALARWHDEELGTVPPDIFIAVAEAYGLIHALGAAVCRQACRQLASWRDSGLSAIQLSINISPLQLERDDLPRQIAAILTECDVVPSSLELELTESALMRDSKRTARLLNQLKAQGIRLALDDFGKGYSSLGYLSHLPLDVIKIDKSFIAGIPSSRHATAITQAVLQLGQALGYAVLAEGVETEQQLDHLRHLGCDAWQGFLLSRPLPPEQCTALLTSSGANAPKARAVRRAD